MDDSKIKKRNNSWKNLLPILYFKIVNAILSIRFVVSFVLGLVVIGGMGIWLPYVVSSDVSKIFWNSENVFTYSLAILGTLLINFTLNKKQTGDLDLLAMLVGIGSLIFCAMGYFYTKVGFELYTVIGMVLAVLLFVFVNADNDEYDSTGDASTSSSTGYSEANKSKIKDH